jgi:hypothetical protein
VALMGEMKNAYKILVGKPEHRILLRIPRRGWVLKNLGTREVWILLAQDRVRWKASGPL